jgi:adenylate kinase family enzyme
MSILIFGNSGSGKTTLARTLAAKHRLAHLDLDSIVWEPGQIAVQRSADAIAASLGQFLLTSWRRGTNVEKQPTSEDGRGLGGVLYTVRAR